MLSKVQNQGNQTNKITRVKCERKTFIKNQNQHNYCVKGHCHLLLYKRHLTQVHCRVLRAANFVVFIHTTKKNTINKKCVCVWCCEVCGSDQQLPRTSNMRVLIVWTAIILATLVNQYECFFLLKALLLDKLLGYSNEANRDFAGASENSWNSRKYSVCKTIK